MDQLQQELFETPIIQEVGLRYAKESVPFSDAFDNAVANAIQRYAGVNPVLANIIIEVVNALEKHLREELRKKPAKTRAGRFFRWLLRINPLKSKP